jgi:broad specificity phosphatase PhoE
MNVAGLLDTAYPGAELDEVGRDQALDLVRRLTDEPIQAIYTSDLTRTQQTARPLARALDLPIHPLAGLREIQAGDLELSADWAPYIQVLSAWADDLAVRMPGSESGHEFLARFDEAVATIHSAGHDTVALVSHGAALRVWASARCPNLTREFLIRVGMPNTVVITLTGDPDAGWVAHQWGDMPVPEAAGS